MTTFTLRASSILLFLFFLTLHSAHGVGRINRRLKSVWSTSIEEDVDLGSTNSTNDNTTLMEEDGFNSTDIYHGGRKGFSKKKKSKKGGKDAQKSAKNEQSGKGSGSKGFISKKGRSSKKRGSKISVSNNTTYSSDDMQSIDTGFFDDDDEWSYGVANSTSKGSLKGSSRS